MKLNNYQIAQLLQILIENENLHIHDDSLLRGAVAVLENIQINEATKNKLNTNNLN